VDIIGIDQGKFFLDETVGSGKARIGGCSLQRWMDVLYDDLCGGVVFLFSFLRMDSVLTWLCTHLLLNFFKIY
jgi:hypothetical protein